MQKFWVGMMLGAWHERRYIYKEFELPRIPTVGEWLYFDKKLPFRYPVEEVNHSLGAPVPYTTVTIRATNKIDFSFFESQGWATTLP
jgi:hypothetical protein